MKNHLAVATALAYMLDNLIGFGKYRFGLSALLDLIPGVGDIIDTCLSLYIVWIAVQMKVPKVVIARMIGNISVNSLIGLIPIVGDTVYFLRKVNMKNVALLKQYAPSPDREIIKGELVAKKPNYI
jgi:uncharacterized protein DUF4112